MSLALDWMIGVDGNWFPLDSLNLNDAYFDKIGGVYIVWYGPNEKGDEGRVVCVGHGLIRCKLENLRNDPVMERYNRRHPLVTWAEVDTQYQKQVEVYLLCMLNPLHGEKHPSMVQTLVNLPEW